MKQDRHCDRHHIPPQNPDSVAKLPKRIKPKHLASLTKLFGENRTYRECKKILWKDWWSPEILEKRPDLRPKKLRAKVGDTGPRFTVLIDRGLHEAYHGIFAAAPSFRQACQILWFWIEATSQKQVHFPIMCDMSRIVPRCIGSCSECRANAEQQVA